MTKEQLKELMDGWRTGDVVSADLIDQLLEIISEEIESVPGRIKFEAEVNDPAYRMDAEGMREITEWLKKAIDTLHFATLVLRGLATVRVDNSIIKIALTDKGVAEAKKIEMKAGGTK